MSEPLRAAFRATLPDIQSALKIGAGQTRVQFDIPKSELHEAIKLALMDGMVVYVTVEPEPLQNSREQYDAVETRTKRKSERIAAEVAPTHSDS